ncbi:MAG: UbiX family flavin prenyltransferase [Halieaceae bacterium]|jgi:4-hydroxy-3-polyprenylbenzoate decarboxylase|nr:UbiX family flavin prenyltransferase [Halieaceae bacterium]
MTQRIIVGITGASGVIYGIRALEALARQPGVESHLILSDSAEINIGIETGYSVDEVRALADVVHNDNNLAASIASGSVKTAGMMIAPCSIKTLSGVATCFANSLMLRAADVVLKESRRLVLVVRETPLHLGHLKLQVQAAEAGAIILPPVPAFYHEPETVDDIINHTVGRIFDQFDLEHDLYRRWGSPRNPR